MSRPLLLVCAAACATAPAAVDRGPELTSPPLDGPRMLALPADDAHRDAMVKLLAEQQVAAKLGREALDAKWLMLIAGDCGNESRPPSLSVRLLSATEGRTVFKTEATEREGCPEAFLARVARAIGRAFKDR